MQIDSHTAVVDNDFVNHLAESKMADDRLVAVLKIIFSELGLVAAMHPLVYEKELLIDKPRISLLFKSNVLKKADFEDIFQNDPARKAYYIYLVTNLYRALMGEALPVSGENVLSYWIRKKSLGEVHSFAMCLICNCSIFLSDDADSKALKDHIDRLSLGKINVYSRDEFIYKHMQVGETKLNRRERQALTHSSGH